MPQNKQKRDEPLGGEGSIRGLPGYRTRDNRSGLDPIDTPAEAAHMEGVFYRNVFYLRLSTRNKFYLTLMFLFGLVPFIFLVCFSIYLVFSDSYSSNPIDWYSLVRIIFFILTTGAITLNFILNILEITGIIPSKNISKPVPKVRKKKYPKRRKDYK
jgi:hypothetical protein